MTQNLALFDFDGTISKKDSMLEFLKFHSGKLKFYLTFLIHFHWLILMLLGVVEKWKVKEKIWITLFGNTNLDTFNQMAERFSLNILPSMLHLSALNQIKIHKKNNDRIIVISASAENWLRPWCEQNHLELICTQLEVENRLITGKIQGENCNGMEKVNRIKQYVDLSNFQNIYAYGNSKGDKAMLALATHPNYKFF